jgi:hypothetical protein
MFARLSVFQIPPRMLYFACRRRHASRLPDAVDAAPNAARRLLQFFAADDRPFSCRRQFAAAYDLSGQVCTRLRRFRRQPLASPLAISSYRRRRH